MWFYFFCLFHLLDERHLEILMTYAPIALAVRAVNVVVMWKYEVFTFSSHKVVRGVSLRATPGLTVLRHTLPRR